MLVIDASAVIEVFVGPEHLSHSLSSLLTDSAVFSPELMDVEVVHTLRRLDLTGQLDPGQAERALEHLALLPIERVPHLPFLPRIWELRANVTAYDAAYVALAETLGATLLTGDRRLSQAPGLRCAVTVIT